MNPPPEKPRKIPAGNSPGAGVRLAAKATALLLPFLAAAQDRATIVGGIADGTPPPPAPRLELPAVEIRETREQQLPDRKITFNRIANPGLPSPRPAVPQRSGLSAEQSKRSGTRPKSRSGSAKPPSPPTSPFPQPSSITAPLFFAGGTPERNTGLGPMPT